MCQAAVFWQLLVLIFWTRGTDFSRPEGKERLTRSFGSYVAISKAMLGCGMLSLSILFRNAGLGIPIVVGLLQAVTAGIGFLLWGWTSWLSGADNFDEAYVRSFSDRDDSPRVATIKRML